MSPDGNLNCEIFDDVKTLYDGFQRGLKVSGNAPSHEAFHYAHLFTRQRALLRQSHRTQRLVGVAALRRCA